MLTAPADPQAKERAKLQGNSEDIYTKYRRVKCFHADARFGVALPTGSLATRQVLAQALTSAFGRWGLKCGDGRELHVLFLDAQGNTAEFPPQRPTDGAHDKEQAARWREASLTAVRVYVR